MWRTPPGSQCGHQEPSFPKAMGTSQMQSKIKKGRKKFKQRKIQQTLQIRKSQIIWNKVGIQFSAREIGNKIAHATKKTSSKNR